MMRCLFAVLLFCASGMAVAADLKVMSAGAVEPALSKLAERFTLETRNKVQVVYATAPQLNRRLANGELADVLIGTLGVMNEQLRRNRIDPETQFLVGRIGVGMVVRLENPEPDISNIERFRQAVRGADSIVYNQASTGLYLETLFELLGIAEEIKPRTTRFARGEEVLEHMLNGRGYELGFAAITIIRQFEPRGLKYVGPLPDQIQTRTAYVAGLMTEASAEDEARDFLKYIATPSAKAVFTAAGIE